MADVKQDTPAVDPPAYTAESSHHPDAGDEAPPEYTTDADIAKHMAGTAAPYRAFPAVMNAHYKWNHIKSFWLCGNTSDDRLYATSVHTGYSGKGPLGGASGMLLHNGTSTKDPILAAAGAESWMATQVISFSLNSVVYLPPIQPNAPTGTLTKEKMQTRANPDKSIGFFFSIEVGEGEKMRREDFEWRKIEKKELDELKEGGFKLLRLASRSDTAGNSSTEATDDEAPTYDGCDVLAVFRWTKTITNLMHPFTLTLKGAGQSGILGGRWTLMTVITALRLWEMHAQGKTSKGHVAVGQQVWN